MINKPTHISIQKLSERTGVAASALRYWQKFGLIKSARQKASGHRWFKLDTIARIEEIKEFQSAGLSLAEIQGALDGNSRWRLKLVTDAIKRMDEEATALEETITRANKLKEKIMKGSQP